MKVGILHFWTLRMRRGVETLVVSLANELAKRGNDVTIITARQTLEPLVLPAPRVRVRAFPTFRYYEFATIVPFYVADLVSERYDIVIAFFADFGEGEALRLASAFTRPRLFLYLTFPYESAPHRYQSYKRWGWEKEAACILADAEYTARNGEVFFQRPVQLLPSGTDASRFRPDPERRAATRRRLGFGEGDIVLLNVAALERRKGAWRVIEALPIVRARCPTVRYLVLGEGAERGRLQGRAEELGISQSVIFAGTTTDLPSYYNAADIFVMLPDSEAGSIACLEAMASELPVVVSNTGGFGEAVGPRCGRIVDISEPGGIADSILQLASDGALRCELGEGGRRVVTERYSWDRIGENLHGLCWQMVRGG
ncbi:MAG: glycosyltransferase family 4 protein [Chloroflexi bacterium]|nr:glycosyltransferase family 4 protein [Chloroflexota bacterium]